MKLFCSGCRCFFEDNEIVYKVISGNVFNYYHKACLDVSDSVVATLPAKKVIETLEGKYEWQKMYRKVCAYEKCEAVFVTKDKDRLFCNHKCQRLHFNEIKKVQSRVIRAKAKMQREEINVKSNGDIGYV